MGGPKVLTAREIAAYARHWERHVAEVDRLNKQNPR